MKKKSINPNNRKEYLIPEILDDTININKFLEKNKGKKVVVVQGLGFVGSVMSLVCCNSEIENYAVIGVDLASESSYWRICSLNEGEFPLISSDKKVYEFFEKSIKKNNFYATFDSYAYSKADYIIVDINLDVDKITDFEGKLINFNVDLTPFKNALNTVANNCMEDVVLLIESTVPPGTTKKVVKPIMEKCFNNRGFSKDKFCLGHSYERVMPGPNYIDSIINFYRVYSGIDRKSELAIEKFLKTIIKTDQYPLTKLVNTNATEIAKVLENSYRAYNIAFMVEWSRFAEKAGVNLYEIVDSIRMRPTHNNMMLPGIGVGGYCLTKDPLLASWAYQNLFDSSSKLIQSEKGVEINDKMPLYAYNFLINRLKSFPLKNSRVLLMGVSYRSDVGDTRHTPVEKFYNFLNQNKCEIFLHDPYVRYWEELEVKVSSTNKNYRDLPDLDFDILIFSTAHKEYRNSKILSKLISDQKKLMIFDMVGILSEDDINKFKKIHTLYVLGRGDLNY